MQKSFVKEYFQEIPFRLYKEIAKSKLSDSKYFFNMATCVSVLVIKIQWNMHLIFWGGGSRKANATINNNDKWPFTPLTKE